MTGSNLVTTIDAAAAANNGPSNGLATWPLDGTGAFYYPDADDPNNYTGDPEDEAPFEHFASWRENPPYRYSTAQAAVGTYSIYRPIIFEGVSGYRSGELALFRQRACTPLHSDLTDYWGSLSSPGMPYSARVAGGQVVTVTGQVYSTRAGFVSGAFSYSSTTLSDTSTISTTSTWVPFSVSTVVPGGERYAIAVWIEVWANSATGDAYLDDISFTVTA